MFYYSAYDLIICSDFVLAALEPVGKRTSPDVVIRYGYFGRPRGKPHPGSFCLRATPDDVILMWEDVGAIRISSGNDVVVDPIDNLNPKKLELIIIGSVFAILLHQRKYLVLHGSAIAIDNFAAVFLGGPGWGKSTLAASLLNRGHDLISDDIVAIDLQSEKTPFVISGFPQLKVWPDVAHQMQDGTNNLSKLYPDIEKRAFRTTRNFYKGTLSFGCIYIIEASDQILPKITPIKFQEALIEIIRHSFLAHLLNRTDSQVLHFRQIIALVNQVPLRRLSRRKSLSDISAVAELVEVDARQS